MGMFPTFPILGHGLFGQNGLPLRFPPGLMKRFPVPVVTLEPCILTPDQTTTLKASALTAAIYQVTVRNIGTSETISSDVQPQAGSMTVQLPPTIFMGKTAWDLGTYLVMLIEKPGKLIALLAFIVS